MNPSLEKGDDCLKKFRYNNYSPLQLQYYCDNVKNMANYRKLSKLTWEICHVSLDKFRKSPKSVNTDRSVKIDSISRRKILWPTLDAPFSVSSDNQPLLQCFCLQGEEKNFILPFPPSIHTVLSGVPVQKPLSLYILKRPGSQGEGSVWGWLSLTPAQ